MKKRNVVLLSLVGIVLLAATVAVVAGKTFVETKLKNALIAQGFEDITFSVSSLGLTGIHFKDISFGEKLPLTLDSLTLDYSIFELMQQQVRDVKIDRLEFKQEKIKTEVNNILLHFDKGSRGTWQGTWSVESVETQNTPLPLPPLSGGGKFTVQKGKIDAEGDFKSADKTYRAEFILHYDSDDAKASRLTVASASLPWKGGVISTRGAVIPLLGGAASSVTLMVANVPLNDLLQGATGGKATATGVVSGTVPVRIAKDGTITFHAGNLKASESGTIILTPDAIPGDNEQVSILRNVLSNFHYSQLAMSMDSDKDEKLSMLLQLSGNNPQVYNGREIKLNVRLTGDVLNLLQQSVMPIANPEQLLKDAK